MATVTLLPPPQAPPAPADWLPDGPPAAPRRDVALDLLRGLAMVILVVNHIHIETVLEHGTRALLSAAEVLVMVSGVVVGMVFGRRWRTRGARATTLQLLRRSRELYVASVVVVALVGLLRLVPWLATDVLAVSPRAPDRDLYAFDGPLRTLLAVVTLEAGPWQFNILGLFIAAMAAAPAILWALGRGWWPAVLAASWGLYLLGRAWTGDVLPSQSERPFPILVWQVLIVHGMVLGWHRERVARALRRAGPVAVGALVTTALALAALRLGTLGAGWEEWQSAHFHKTTLDPLRIATMATVAGAVYALLRRHEAAAERTVGRVLLPLGRNSFYVFIVHVFLCLTVASVPGVPDGGAAGVAIQIGCVAVLWAMVERRVLFRWIPR